MAKHLKYFPLQQLEFYECAPKSRQRFRYSRNCLPSRSRILARLCALALKSNFRHWLAALLIFSQLLRSLLASSCYSFFFLALRRSSSNAWHSTANAFQRKVFKQIFAQLAGSAQAQAERWSPRGRGRQERQAGGWGRLHVSFFLFFAPAFKQCAARRTVCARLEEASRNSVR